MRVLWSTAVVLLIDQLTKVIVVHTMYRGQSIPFIGDWLKLTFTENPGMAFGIAFGPPGMVTVLSILATGLIVFYMYRVQGTYTPYRLSLAVILGGALGNIIDRVFYGLFFDYGPLFKGKVVDFIHVDLWRGIVPEAIPVIGGNYMALFPIWNVADMAIVGGVIGILVFQHRFHEDLERAHRVGLNGAPTMPWDRGERDEPVAFVPPRMVPIPAPGNGQVGDATVRTSSGEAVPTNEPPPSPVDPPESTPEVDGPSTREGTDPDEPPERLGSTG